MVRLLVLVALLAIPLALYRGYVEDQRFGIEPGETRMLPDPRRGITCGSCWDDYELKHYIVGCEDGWRAKGNDLD